MRTLMELDMKKYYALVATLILALQALPTFAQGTQPPSSPTASAAAEPSKEGRSASNQQAAGDTTDRRTNNDNKPSAGANDEKPSKTPGQGAKVNDRNPNIPDQRGVEPPVTNPMRTPFGNINQSVQPTPSPDKIQDGRLEQIENRLGSLENLGPLGWFTSPLLFWTTAMLFLLSIALHAVHLLKDVNTSRMVNQLWNVQQRSANANRSAAPGRNGAVESLTEQVREQGKGMNQFTAQVSQLQDRLAERERQFADAVQAVTLTVNWISQAQLREAAANDGGQISEEDRASAIALLERYEEPLRANAVRVEPLAQAMAALMEKIETQPQMPPELVSRAQSLHHDIGQFDLWQTNVSSQLASLRRGSFSARNASLQADQQRLIEQVNAGGLSVSQMVQKSRELLDNHFPRNSQKSLTRLPSVEDEAEFKKRIASAPESLMDWFDSFSQFQSQMIGGQASRVQLDPDIMSRLAQVQTAAREALNKFDIQPEEIQVGRTGYDRRLHEATLVRQSQQFPTNTVIEVLRCGFRRISTGEVLRRPQVVVAGAVAG